MSRNFRDLSLGLAARRLRKTEQPLPRHKDRSNDFIGVIKDPEYDGDKAKLFAMNPSMAPDYEDDPFENDPESGGELNYD